MPVKAKASPRPAGEAQAFWVVSPGRGEIRTQLLPDLQPGEASVRAVASGVSRGTESLVFRGEVPRSEWERMRCPFQAGAFPVPVKYGYSMVGVVERGPSELAGTRVFCLHPHQDRFVVPAGALIAVPDGVPDRRAALAANMETAINGLWDGTPGPGDRIAVIGGGVVGALAAALAARIPGAEVELIDTNPDRAALAAGFGCRFALPADARPEADLVLHASGNPTGLRTALALAGFEATVVELSWYGTKAVTLPLGEAFHARRLTLRSSQVGAVPADRRGRWPRRRRLALALELLRDPVFDLLLTGDSAFGDLPSLMPVLAGAPGAVLWHTLHYD